MCSELVTRGRGHRTLNSQCEGDITSNVRALSRTRTVIMYTIQVGCFQFEVVTR